MVRDSTDRGMADKSPSVRDWRRGKERQRDRDPHPGRTLYVLK